MPRHATFSVIALLGCFLIVPATFGAQSKPGVQDIFDRDITQSGITLIDWEGYMANPAISFNILPPSDASFPIHVVVGSLEPRLYFDLPSEAGPQGPRKQLTFNGDSPLSMSVSIFPARIKTEKEISLNILLTDSKKREWLLAVPVHVIVSGHPAKPSATTKPTVFPITVDFSQDKTGFFKDAARRKLFDQAIQDWAFYLAPIPLPQVRAGGERTWIFEPSGFTKSNLITNAQPYTGYLLYAYGIDGPEIRSGGEPSGAGALQQSAGVKMPFHRSGGLELEIKGNYNRLGWNFTLRDDEWWKATNLGNVQNDFYSIVHHESGHALFFNPNNTRFLRGGVLHDERVKAYLGIDPKTDVHDHFDGIIDPASLHGAFGNEYHGKVPMGRWVITKLDLLSAQAVGYTLRDVDSLTPLSIQSSELPAATLRKTYAASLQARGGIPFYDWKLAEGQLPIGLSLNRFNGEITGVPTQSGSFTVTISVRDYTKNGAAVSRQFNLVVN